MQQPSTMDRDTFVSTFGGVFEHSAWVAEDAFDAGIGPAEDSAEGLHAAMCAAMRRKGPEAVLVLIRAHPDLAGRLADADDLTPASAIEQHGAGLDRLSPEEFGRFTELNEAYKAKFGFPFIMAVRGRSKDAILEAFQRRLDHDADAELAGAIEAIETIARLRIEALLAAD